VQPRAKKLRGVLPGSIASHAAYRNAFERLIAGHVVDKTQGDGFLRLSRVSGNRGFSVDIWRRESVSRSKPVMLFIVLMAAIPSAPPSIGGDRRGFHVAGVGVIFARIGRLEPFLVA
jgi:hypothetical protein